MTAMSALLLAAAVAAAPAADPAAPGSGCLYGTVLTVDGDSATGFLRTDDWDTWWDDGFNADRTASPWLEHVDLEEIARERRAEYFKDHGLLDRLVFVLGGDDKRIDATRVFLCRYGQIARIVLDEDGAVVETTDGERHAVRRRGRDLRGELTVVGTDSLVLDFDDLREIAFGAAPAGATPPWRRLAGTVITSRDTLRGFVRWDRSECTDLDILDGKDDAGDHDLPMGTVASIARERDGSRVILRDGRSLLLTGTNDVNADNRGISVETADRGRVTVPWKHFVRVDFLPPGGSGPGRDDYPAALPLGGTATGRDGRRHRGRLVWDLDEGWTWDLLNGSRDGIEYDIPFSAVSRVEPGAGSARVLLRSGVVLELDGGTDVTGANNGVLVVGPAGSVRIPWRDLAAAEFAD